MSVFTAYNGLLKCASLDIHTVLDVGSGLGKHTKFFKSENKQVTSIDIIDREYNVVGNYLDTEVEPHDLVWAAHILEHQPNVNEFLKKCRTDCFKYICITVPPAKPEIVGGHLTTWNAGLVMYNLVLAGFDCKNAKILQYGYNLSIIAEVGNFELPDLNYDNGDIEKISKWLPLGYNYQGFNGNITNLNW